MTWSILNGQRPSPCPDHIGQVRHPPRRGDPALPLLPVVGRDRQRFGGPWHLPER